MKKNLLALLIFTVFLSGCSKNTGNSEEDAVKLNKEKKSYNDFLGLSYTIPKGWWIYEISEENLSDSRGVVLDPVSMDIFYNEFNDRNYSNIWLASFGNLKSSSSDNHLGFTLNAWNVDGIDSMSGFVRYLEIYMLEPTEEAEYELTDSEEITINGKVFEMRDFLVKREQDDYQIMTLCCEAKNGYFFISFVDYWPENTGAKKTIIESIGKAIEFY